MKQFECCIALSPGSSPFTRLVTVITAADYDEAASKASIYIKKFFKSARVDSTESKDGRINPVEEKIS